MAACAVALLVKAVPVPYVSALALVGLLGGLLLGPGQLQLTHSLILFVLLPGLLFEAAFNLSWRELRANLVAVVALATLGVVLTTAVVAVVGHAALGLALPVAILLGTMISPTDPVAVVAVFAAGLVLGNLGRPRAMSVRTQEAVTLFWDYVAFLLNSLVFLLVGLDVPWSEVRSQLPGIMVAALIALLARALAVYAVLGLLHPLPWRVSLRWQHLVVWSGLRGAIAVALALSLTETNPQFNSIRALVYGVVLLSILLQGSTIGPLARLLLRAAGEAPKPA